MKDFAPSLDKIQKDLWDILGEDPGDNENKIYREMMWNISLLKKEKLDFQELRLLSKAFRELRHALRIFKRYRQIPKAAVFGSARTGKNHPDYKLATEFGRKLAKKGWMIITGAASGIMEAAMVGAGARQSFGLNILLPFEQEPNVVIRGSPNLMYFKYFFTRKLMFLKESESTVLFPGGFGTFDEGFESFTLVQTGKAKPRPIVLLDSLGSDYWDSILKLLKKNMEDRNLIAPGDLSLMRHFHTAEEAVEEITRFYSNYHSSRFLKKDLFLIRLRKPLTRDKIRNLNRDFKDLLMCGEFQKVRDLKGDDETDPSLERMIFYFNRVNFYRLRQLIDVLNGF